MEANAVEMDRLIVSRYMKHNRIREQIKPGFVCCHLTRLPQPALVLCENWTEICFQFLRHVNCTRACLVLRAA